MYNQLIVKIMVERGLKRVDVARSIGISLDELSKIESGEMNVTPSLAIKFAEVFDFPAVFLDILILELPETSPYYSLLKAVKESMTDEVLSNG